MDTKSFVYCVFQIEAWHKWAGAPEHFSYLSQSHRHMFHFKVGVEVKDDDREIEFINMRHLFLGHMTKSFMQSSPTNPLLMSCEMMAKGAINYALHEYGKRSCFADVSEDGENGSYVTHNGADNE